MIPESVIQDDNEHTMHYSQSLPYANLLDNEAKLWLNDICTNLVISVKAKDYTGATLAWVKRLSSYLDMKHAIDKQTRINLAKLLYELIVMPGMDPALVELWSVNCIRLIRHKKRLDPTDLELPWRPLYELIEKTLFPKTRQRAFISESKLISAVLRLVSHAQRFFPANATEEILQEFLPTFNPHHVSEAQRVLSYIVLFLPTENQPSYTMKAQDCLSTIFSLWSTLTMSNSIDMQFALVFSHIAERNIAEGSSQVSLFTKDQVKTMYTVLLRMLNLPVGTRGDGSNGNGGATTGYGSLGTRVEFKTGNSAILRRRPERFKSMARFIVYTIMPDLDGGKSYSLNSLADLIQATELYFHPSNSGSWSYFLPELVKHLSNLFLKRWREEQEEDCTTPQHKRLTPQLRQEFVLILRPVTYLSMFGKDPLTVSISQASLKYLAWLEPSVIFPGLLERIYPSLETLTETHRTSSVLSILTDIALPLFSRDHYPAGGKHLLPLLQLAIPGIDMNDPVKTISSLMFISSALMSIPIFDLTQVPSDYYPMENDIGVEGAELSRETEDYLVKATTGEFEEWLAKFMRRVFVIFENLPQENRKKQNNNMEVGLTQMLLHTCDIIFNQLSDRLYDLALKLVVEFVGDRVLPNAVRAVGQLCDALTSVNPKKASKVFVPLCITHIQIELEHGAASTVSHSDTSNLIPSDTTFHWYQNILFSVVSSMGPEILNYQKDIVDISQAMISQCRSRRGMMWTGKLVRGVLNTMLNVYPSEYKSLNPSQWQDKEFMEKNAHLLWGQPGDPANLEIQWHTPSEPEKEFALAFLSQTLTPSINRLKELMQETQSANNSHQMSNEFCRHLAILRNCLMGSSTMVADDGVKEESDRMDVDGEAEVDGDDDDDAIKVPKLEVGYAFTDESDPRINTAREIRRSIGELIHQLAEYFKTKREDDVESIKIWIKIARTYLSERGVEKSQFDHSKSGYSYAKNVGTTPLCKKRYPRNLLIRRAFNHHLLRLRQNVQGRVRTPMHDAILLDLLEMSLGSYAEIRKFSQVALTATARCFRDSKSLIIPVLLDALQPDTPADRMKGALYLFVHKSIIMSCLRNWRFIPDFVMALCGAQHQDKLTIQELARKVFVNYLSYFNSFSFRVLEKSDIDPILQALSPETVNQSDFTQRAKTLEAAVLHRASERVKAYEGLLVKLLAFLQDSRVHWRYATMAANLIEVFIRSDAKPTKDLAAFANNAALSELPIMRRIGVSATIQLLLAIKQRTFAKGNEDLLITRSTRNPLKIQIDVKDGETEKDRLLEASYQPLSDNSILVDDLDVGWYVWPEKYTVYKVNTYGDFMLSDESIDPGSSEAYQEFKKTFVSSEYWEKLCSYVSQEINNKDEDRFSSSHARLFASIFQMFGDAPLASAKVEIEKLCEAGSDQKNAQRAASEILAGLIRGTKHWSVQKLDALWRDWLTPLLTRTFNGITPDSLTYWESFVRFCAQRRDPRRIQPLMNLILEAKMDPTSDAAFNESKKIVLARTLMVSLQWRFHPLIDRILPMYLNNVQHPYKQVREVIGLNINQLLQLEWIPSYPSVPRLLEINAKIDGVGNVPTTLTPHQAERTQVLLNKLDVWLEEMNQSASTSGSSDYAHASKTILCWLYEATKDWVVSGTLPYALPFLPKLFAMQEINDDQDLQVMATRVLSFVARLNYPPSMVPDMIDAFLNILTTSPSWHIRIRALPVLQIFFFKHLFMMNSEELIRIMQVIGNMLMDSQIEVRQLASVTLGGLVRCSQRDAIQSLLTQFTTKIAVRVPKRKRDKVTGKNVEPAGFAEAVLEKHAGVLGISCLINAFPYEVPEWMPSILCQLADCMSEPAAEIQATIRKTFSDFRRTHSDTWHEDMHKFTEDQLSLLSDMLISPSYYA